MGKGFDLFASELLCVLIVMPIIFGSLKRSSVNDSVGGEEQVDEVGRKMSRVFQKG